MGAAEMSEMQVETAAPRTTPRLAAAVVAAILLVASCVTLFSGGLPSDHTQSRKNMAPSTEDFSIFNIAGRTCTTVSSLDIDSITGTWYQVVNNRYTTTTGQCDNFTSSISGDAQV